MGRVIHEELLRLGVAREIARMHLPLNVYTTYYWKINLRSLFNFLKPRLDNHAQYEIRQYAQVIAGIVRKICPISFQAFLLHKFDQQFVLGDIHE